MTDSPGGFSPPDLNLGERVCAIHQPNFFPRLSTLTKLFLADHWVVLDDVQFTRRDYQHRARVAPLDYPPRPRWLSLAVHLPDGRATRISDAAVVDPVKCRRRVAMMLRERYRASPHWSGLSEVIDTVLAAMQTTDRLSVIAEASTLGLLRMLGWPGTVTRSSDTDCRTDRSQRLVDLALATQATTYLCGRGGMTYLEPAGFQAAGVDVLPLRLPTSEPWDSGYRLSAAHALMSHGPHAVVDLMTGVGRTLA
ncbi:WbqC family protein [Actinoplanes sp. NPDC049802]|uniref:WbqC family protein n=1 Tax=Actinoplanes sp. NPDC049802 TaxID=3154742 RepID=UPI0033EC7F2F